MIVLTNCLTNQADEGCLKLANSLTKRLKSKFDDTKVLSYERYSELSDVHLKLNKLFISKELISHIRKDSDDVLYIPFSSNTMASVVRTFILSLFTKGKLKVAFVLQHPLSKISTLLLRLSKAQLVLFSKNASDYFSSITKNDINYIKCGVDTEKFRPVSAERKAELKQKYGISSDKKVVLHVGHLKKGRNVEQLLKVDKNYHVLLCVSTQSENERDTEFYDKFAFRECTTVIDTYVENIQQLYQLSDVYLFPVTQEENCIDVPLSALEAAACGVPVVTTAYGELRELIDKDGFFEIDSFEQEELNNILDKAVNSKSDVRASVLPYDFNNALLSLVK